MRLIGAYYGAKRIRQGYLGTKPILFEYVIELLGLNYLTTKIVASPSFNLALSRYFDDLSAKPDLNIKSISDLFLTVSSYQGITAGNDAVSISDSPNIIITVSGVKELSSSQVSEVKVQSNSNICILPIGSLVVSMKNRCDINTEPNFIVSSVHMLSFSSVQDVTVSEDVSVTVVPIVTTRISDSSEVSINTKSSIDVLPIITTHVSDSSEVPIDISESIIVIAPKTIAFTDTDNLKFVIDKAINILGVRSQSLQESQNSVTSEVVTIYMEAVSNRTLASTDVMSVQGTSNFIITSQRTFSVASSHSDIIDNKSTIYTTAVQSQNIGLQNDIDTLQGVLSLIVNMAQSKNYFSNEIVHIDSDTNIMIVSAPSFSIQNTLSTVSFQDDSNIRILLMPTKGDIKIIDLDDILSDSKIYVAQIWASLENDFIKIPRAYYVTEQSQEFITIY